MSGFRNAEPSSSNSVDSVEDFVSLSRLRFNPQSNKKAIKGSYLCHQLIMLG